MKNIKLSIVTMLFVCIWLLVYYFVWPFQKWVVLSADIDTTQLTLKFTPWVTEEENWLLLVSDYFKENINSKQEGSFYNEIYEKFDFEKIIENYNIFVSWEYTKEELTKINDLLKQEYITNIASKEELINKTMEDINQITDKDIVRQNLLSDFEDAYPELSIQRYTRTINILAYIDLLQGNTDWFLEKTEHIQKLIYKYNSTEWQTYVITLVGIISYDFHYKMLNLMLQHDMITESNTKTELLNIIQMYKIDLKEKIPHAIKSEYTLIKNALEKIYKDPNRSILWASMDNNWKRQLLKRLEANSYDHEKTQDILTHYFVWLLECDQSKNCDLNDDIRHQLIRYNNEDNPFLRRNGIWINFLMSIVPRINWFQDRISKVENMKANLITELGKNI